MLAPYVVFISFLITLGSGVAIPQSVPQHVRCPKNDGSNDPRTAPAGPAMDVSKIPTFDAMLAPTAEWLETMGLAGSGGDPEPHVETHADPNFTTDLVGKHKRDEFDIGTDLVLRDETLRPRAPDRHFAAPNYRAIALQSGLVVINAAAAATGGALIQVGQFAGQIASNLWHGDHKFELNLLNLFLTKTNMRPGYDTWNYPHIWNQILRCSAIKQRVTDILNAPSNLIGLQSDINLLKAILLQRRGVRDWSRWDPVVIGATLNYLELIQQDFLNVATRLGQLLNDIAGMPDADPHVTDSPGMRFIEFCATRLFYAIGTCENNQGRAAVGPGPNHQVLQFAHIP